MYLFDPVLNARALSSIGLDLASRDELATVHCLAKDMIGDEVASLDTLRRVQAHTGAAVFIYREVGEITGFLAWLPLTEKGLTALLDGRFTGLEPSAAHVCRPGDAGAAAYGWGYAGRSRRASAAVIKGTLHARRVVCPELPFFTRGATPDGARLLSGRLDCRPFPIERPGLFWSPPLTPAGVEAAA